MSYVFFVIGGYCAAVALVFLHLMRTEPGRALRYWVAGWWAVTVLVALYALQAVLQLDDPTPIQAPISFLTTAAPFLFLAGYIAYSGRAVPAWLAPVGLAACLLRAGIVVGGSAEVNHLLAFPIEMGLALVGGALVLRVVPEHSRPAAPILLGVTVVSGGLWNGAIAYTALHGEVPLISQLFAWGLAGLIAVAQLLAILANVRDREDAAQRSRERDLDLLRRLAQQGMVHGSSDRLVESVLETLRERLALDLGGVWLVDEEHDCLSGVGSFGLAPGLQEPLRSISLGDGSAASLLSTRAPLFAGDRGAERRFRFGAADLSAGGVQGAALLPLWREDVLLGVLFAGLLAPRRFDENDRDLLIAVADELSLALHHVQAVEHLRRERRTLRSILETSPAGVVVEDEKRKVTILSEVARRHLGLHERDEWAGRDIEAVIESVAARARDRDEWLESVRTAVASSEVESFEVVLIEDDLRRLVLATSPVAKLDDPALGRIWVTHDQTAQHHLEGQLREAQKLDTLGRLAGGIAHDFNNQLAAILGNAQLLRSAATTDDVRESLRDLEASAQHCARLTTSLLAFARRAPVVPTAVDVEAMLGEVHTLLRSLIPSEIDLEISASPAVGRAAADPTQLQQALVNLAVNARDAIDGPGTIRIEARNQLLPVDSGGGSKAAPEPMVEFVISDTGSGMDAETVDYIFEPFFTTKGPGEGTGLGLSIVYGVVIAHGGTITVESTPDEGTSFCMRLPSSIEVATDAEAPTVQAAASGHETILVADDEALLRRFALRLLVRRGFSVLEATDGNEAVEVFEEHPGEIDLVLLDMSMPGRSGAAALAAIRQIAPDVPVLLVSGMGDSGVLEEEYDRVEFLGKPYDPDELTARMRKMLDARAAAAPA